MNMLPKSDGTRLRGGSVKPAGRNTGFRPADTFSHKMLQLRRIIMSVKKIEADVIILGGGSAGTFAAIKAKETNPNCRVVVVDKGPIETSGAIGRGMDALNIVSVPGYGTPEDVVEALTKVPEGIIDQECAYVLGRDSLPIIKDLERYTDRKPGDLFPLDKNGNYKCSFLHPTNKALYLAMDGEDIKRGLAREVRKLGCTVLDRTPACRLLTDDNGKIAGVFAFNMRSGDYYQIEAPAVVITAGCVGKFGMPRDGYLSGIYEFPGNTGGKGNQHFATSTMQAPKW